MPNYYWVGAVSSDWSDPFNWDLVPGGPGGAGVPGPGDNANFASGSSYGCIVDVNVTVDNIYKAVDETDSLNLGSGGHNVNVTGDIYWEDSLLFGRFLMGNANVTVGGKCDISVSNDDLYLTSGVLRIGGDFLILAGSGFSHNNGTVEFNGAGSQSVNLMSMTGVDLYDVLKTGAGTVTFTSHLGGHNLSVSNGILDLSGQDFTLTGNLTQTGGTVDASLSSLPSVDGNFSLSVGTFEAPAATLVVAGNLTVTSGAFNHNNGTVRLANVGGSQSLAPGPATFYDVVHDGTGDLSINGALNCNSFESNGGSCDCYGAVAVADNFTLGLCTFTAPYPTLSVGGNFTKVGGSFDHNEAKVVFTNPAKISLISAPGILFKDLTFGASKTHRFAAGQTFNVEGELASNGTLATQAVLVSSAPGNYWNLNLSLSDGSSTLADKANITDCNASSGLTVDAVGSTDGGHNLNINFGASPPTGAVTGFAVYNALAQRIVRGATGVAYPVEANIVFDADTPNVNVEVKAWKVTNPAVPVAVLPDPLPVAAANFLAGVSRTLANVKGSAVTFTPPTDDDFALVLAVANPLAAPDYQSQAAGLTTRPVASPTPPPPPVPPSPIQTAPHFRAGAAQPFGPVCLNPALLQPFNTIGDWGLKVNQPNYLGNGFFVNSVSGVPVPGQTIEFRFALPAGRYTLRLFAPSGPDCCTFDLAMNGVSLLVGQDLYAAALDPANVVTVPIVVADSGIQTLTVTIAGKNALSTSYFFRLHQMQLVPYLLGTL